ncbi:MAG: ATP-binding protein [Nocardioidaceae bacterium]
MLGTGNGDRVRDLVSGVELPYGLSSAAIARAQLGGFLIERKLPQTLLDDAFVVVSELVSNAVRHAMPSQGGQLSLSWALTDEGLLVSLHDGGGPSTPKALAISPYAEHGRGLAIVASLAQSWWVEQDQGGTTVNAVLAVA